MADLLLIKAKQNEQGFIFWEFVDEAYSFYKITVVNQPDQYEPKEGDIWQVELIEKKGRGLKKQAIVRMIVKEQEQRPWQKIVNLNDHWVPENRLRVLLAYLDANQHIMFIGPKGSGKTTLGYKICQALGWQDPYKVDLPTIKRPTDLFGSDSAENGSTSFKLSGLFDYINRAIVAEREGLEQQFLVILDETNRIHPKVKSSIHGMFDHTRQVTIPTSEGSLTVKIPMNVHFIGTINIGAEYLGTFGDDNAWKDRFMPFKIGYMPLDFEVNLLIKCSNVREAQALAIVEIARSLRDAEKAGQVSFSPSFRGCLGVASLVARDIDLREAVLTGFLDWYQGELEIDARGEVIEPNSEVAKAYSALRMRALVTVEKKIKEAADTLL